MIKTEAQGSVWLEVAQLSLLCDCDIKLGELLVEHRSGSGILADSLVHVLISAA